MFQVIEAEAIRPADEMNGEQLSAFMDKVDQLEAWCKSIRSATKAAIENGGEVPGWKIIEGRKTRQWVDETEAEKRFKKLIKNNVYVPRKLKSPAQMEKMVSKEAVAELVTSQSTTTTLVRDTNPAQALVFEPMFEEIGE
jgi:ABC-type nitrate/sulfonate/bicarbonate transport system substrate-binding protein